MTRFPPTPGYFDYIAVDVDVADALRAEAARRPGAHVSALVEELLRERFERRAK